MNIAFRRWLAASLFFWISTTACAQVSLMPGQSLSVNQQLVSVGGLYRLIMQGDGNLAYYRANNTSRWDAGTNGTGAVVAVMQGDGNFVIYDSNGRAVWATNTSGRPGAYLTTQTDGNLVVYWNGQAIWHLGQDPEITAAGQQKIMPGYGIWANQQIVSANQYYRLVMQSDGNLVYYRSNGTVRWAASTNGTGAMVAIMQGDGNFVMYDGNWSPIWATNTAGHPGAHITTQDDGNLVVYWNGQAIWHMGQDPEMSKPLPSAPGDIIGRDLAVGVVAPLGHVAFWDGQNVFEVMNEGQVVQYNTLDNLRSRVAPWAFWGAGRPNLPDYQVVNCWRGDFCTEADRFRTNTRYAMIYRARQIRQIGATYTLGTSFVSAQPASAYYPGLRGVYRCDTFVFDVYRHGGVIVDSQGWTLNLAALPADSPIRRWIEYRDNNMQNSLNYPLSFFNAVKGFGG